MKFVEHKGKQIAYSKEGKGVPLVFIHGFCEDSRVWDEFIERFVDWCKIIRIDLPGFGQSEVQPGASIADMAEGVNTVLEYLKIDQFFLIGHSMGGYVSLAYAEQYASNLMGLCLFHSQPYADSAEKKQGRQKGIDFIRRIGHTLYVKQLIPALFSKDFASDHQMLIEKLSFRANQYDSAGIIGGLEAMKNRPDRSEVLRQLSCPVLFIVGKEDGAIPTSASLEQLYLPEVASIHLLPRVGHMGMFEATKKCYLIIKNFVEFCQA
ncbi:MAG: alpha/beta hydrolase [Bacteroidota bacterium]